jgi:hypothetical protein
MSTRKKRQTSNALGKDFPDFAGPTAVAFGGQNSASTDDVLYITFFP